MKFFALLLSSTLALSACVSTTQTSGSSSQKSTPATAKDNGRLSVETSDIQVYAATGGPKSSRTQVVGPVLFSPKSSTATAVTFPVSVVYRLKDNERTARIKEKGAVVYVEAVPFLLTHDTYPDGRKDTSELGAKIEDYRYGCARVSRMVALAPANDYKIEYVTDQEIFIRSKDNPGYADKTITKIDPGGRVYQASLKRISSQFRKTCYVRRTRAYFK